MAYGVAVQQLGAPWITALLHRRLVVRDGDIFDAIVVEVGSVSLM